jgi:hypothetical protein
VETNKEVFHLKTIQTEPTVVLWLSIWDAPVRDKRRSRSTVRSTLIKHLYQNLINTWLSRLRQEGEFIITLKSTFQRRSTCNPHWLPLHLLYLRYLFHISCYSNSCIHIILWNTHLRSELHSRLLETSVGLGRQSLPVGYLTVIVGTG